MNDREAQRPTEVTFRQPRTNRRFMALGVACGGVAMLLTVFILLPKSIHASTVQEQVRQALVLSDRKLACRNNIGNALQSAQAEVSTLLADAALTKDEGHDNAALKAQLRVAIERANALVPINAGKQATCDLDPSYTLPADLVPS